MEKIFGIKEEVFDRALKVVDGLFKLSRTGWVRRGVKNPETVGEHSDSLVALADKVCQVRKELDEKKLKRMLQIHDWPENLIGDIVTANADKNIRQKMLQDKYANEITALTIVCSKLGPEGQIILDLWKEFEEGKTPEAQIAKQLDKLQAMQKAWEYENGGEKGVLARDFIDYDEKKITDPLLISWLNELKEEMGKKKKI
ncbi:MAG: HD domain-containing protein [Patescibacteria group bacterium]|nr:HD domain-containing protein [Patescibacteria group bacterium]MDD4610441.1 HD domain-containing protein [Patescibacteria group bacterium]